MIISYLSSSSYYFFEPRAVEANRQRVIFAAEVWTEVDWVREVQLVELVQI